MWTTPKGNTNLMTDIPRPRERVNFSPTATISTTFTPLAALNLRTNGSDLLVGFYTSVSCEGGGVAYFDVALDGVGDLNGALCVKAGSNPTSLSMTLRLEAVSPEAHTLTLQWRTDRGVLEGGYGQFWAVEV